MSLVSLSPVTNEQPSSTVASCAPGARPARALAFRTFGPIVLADGALIHSFASLAIVFVAAPGIGEVDDVPGLSADSAARDRLALFAHGRQFYRF